MNLGARVLFTRKSGGTPMAHDRDGTPGTIAAIFKDAYTIRFDDGQNMHATADELEET